MHVEGDGGFGVVKLNCTREKKECCDETSSEKLIDRLGGAAERTVYFLLVHSLEVSVLVSSPGGISGRTETEDHCPHTGRRPTGLRGDIIYESTDTKNIYW